MTLASVLKNASSVEHAGIVFVSSPVTEETLTYHELYRVSLRLLGALQARGLRKGHELVIQTDNNREFVCLFWACLLGGIIPVPLSGGVQTEQKLKFFQVWTFLSKPHLVCDSKHLARLESIATDEALTDCFRHIADNHLDISTLFLHQASGIETPIRSKDIAYIQFSSGSTGSPKGVCLTHANLIANVRDISDSLHISDSDTLLNWMPLTHDMGIIGFHLLSVWRTIPAVSMSTSLLIRNPLSWMDLVAAHKATVLYSPNFGLQYFLNAVDKSKRYEWDLSCIRIIVNGAEPISPQLCERFIDTLKVYGLRDHTMVAAYGLAEASVEVSATVPGTPIRSHHVARHRLNTGDKVQFVDAASTHAVSFVEVGQPVKACHLRIAGDSDKALPELTIGHIQIKGKNITSGYYHNEKATKEIFTADGWLKTGDLGFLVDGKLVVTGRLKNIIIINGQNYYPQDIERAVIDSAELGHGKVAACGIRKKEFSNEQLVIFLLHKESDGTFASIAAKAREAVFTRIGIQVDLVIAVNKMPKTTSGKIRHFRLAEQYLTGEFDDAEQLALPAAQNDAAIPLTDIATIQKWVAQEAAALLGIPGLEEQANLFAAGMNSLIAMQLAERLSRGSGRNISVEAIFNHPGIPSLSEYIRTAGNRNAIPVLQRGASPSTHLLSLAQKRLFAEYLVNPGSGAYNIPVVYTISGDFKVKIFKEALSVLIHRYEILRTSFHADIDMRQDIHPFGQGFSVVQEIDLRGSGNIADIDNIINAEINRPFQLETPSQYRATVVRLDETTQVLVFVIHHILADGWSLEIIFNELFNTYNVLLNGEEVASAPSRLQYSDYVAWQNELLHSDELQRQRKYWLGELKELPTPVDISTVTAAVSPGHARMGHYRFLFDASSTRQLEELSEKYKTSVFSILLSLLNVIVYRYSNQRDITIGFDTAGRVSKEMEEVVGYTLNTLPLRTAVDPAQSFCQLAAGVHQKVMQALDHPLYPFEKMLEEVNTGGRHLDNPLFTILVLSQNFYHRNTNLHLDRCTIQKQYAAVRHGFVDLLLEFENSGAGLALQVYYHELKYTAFEIMRFTQHLRQLLATVVKDDSQQVGTCDFLTLAEKEVLFPVSDDNKREQLPLLPVHICFEQQAKLSPQKTALYAGDKELTYKALNKRANAVAHHLISKGNLQPEVRIGFMVARDEKIPIAMLGILKAGACYVALDHEYPASRCQQIAADSGMRYLLVDNTTFEKVNDSFPNDLLINLEEPSFLHADLPDPGYPGGLHNLAYIIYTSGSTGQPKGVMIEHESLAQYVQHFASYYGLTSSDIVMQQASVVFDTIVEELFPALCCSASIVIAPHGGRDVSHMLELIASHKVSILSTTPLVLHEINTQVDTRIASLRLVISGGDTLYPHYIDKIFSRLPVYNTYGPSEATVCATYHALDDLAGAGMIGKPIGDRFIYIRDENGEVLPWGRAGEICIEGGLARGYLNQPALTAEKFIPSPGNRDKKIYRTGDRGRFTNTGDLVFLGRKDDQLKVSGHRVEPGEIEKIIGIYPGIEEAVVLPDANNQFVIAYLTVNEQYQEKELRAFLAGQLPYYMIPQRFRILDRMPLTTSGKIDRKKLAAGETIADNASRPPLGFLEEKLAKIICTILDIDSIGALDNIFEQGCNSIKASRLKGLVRQDLGYDISIRDIFLFPTIALLAEKMEGQPSSFGRAISPSVMAASYPLSPAQKRLWLLQRMNKQSFAYNEGELFLLTGNLDAGMLKLAFKAIVDRHEILRTLFSQEGAEPCQVIEDAAVHQLCFNYADMCKEAAPMEAARVFAEQQLRIPYDLSHGPLYRLVLVKLSDDMHLFAMGMHHIITDDWSAMLLMKEFQENYTALEKNRFTPAPAAVLQFKDYAGWANGRDSDTQLLKSREYWISMFRDDLPVLDIFPDFPRPPVKQYDGGIFHFEFDHHLVKQVHALCRKENISLFMCLLSALYVLLHRYSRQTNIVIGTPIADREHPDLRDMVGFFIHTLPLGIQIDGDDTIENVWQKVKATCIDAYAHQSYPLELLVDDLHLRRDLGRSPLFDVLINVSSRESGIADAGSMTCNRVQKRNAGSKYDLEFYFEEENEGLRIALVYDKQLYTSRRIAQMTGHFNNILQLFLAERNCSIGKLPYLPQPEITTLLTDFNATTLELPGDSVTKLFAQQVERNGEQIAVSCQDRSYTYDQINRKAKFFAERLIYHYGVRPADKVCLLLERNEFVIIAILAIWKAGAAYVPIDTSIPAERMAKLITVSGASIVITDFAHLSTCDALSERAAFKTVCISDTETAVEKTKGNGHGGSEDEIAYMLFTSGSTGEPKGVEIAHRSLANLLQSVNCSIAMQPGSTMLSITSYTFDISITEFFLPLIKGARLFIATTAEVLNARQLNRLLSDVKPGYMQATPSLWNALIDSGWAGSPQLVALSCGEPVTEDLRNKMLDRTASFWNMYGPTETTIYSSGERLLTKEGIVPIGKPLHNTQFFILDERLQPVPVGVEGQLYIGGKGLAKGYWNQPALTAEKFLDKLPFYNGRVYATGDSVRWLPDGSVEYRGRKDNQVKIRGYRIELGEIEHMLLQYRFIQSAAVLVKTESDGDKTIVAFVVQQPGSSLAIEEVQAFLRTRLAPYMLPAHYIVMDRLPLLASGKVDRKLLLSLASQQTPARNTEYIAPATRIETMLAEMWEQILGRKMISATDNFFNIGGNSLKANQLVNHVYNRLSLEIMLIDIFNHATIQQLGARIESLETEQYDFVELA